MKGLVTYFPFQWHLRLLCMQDVFHPQESTFYSFAILWCRKKSLYKSNSDFMQCEVTCTYFIILDNIPLNDINLHETNIFHLPSNKNVTI